IEQADVDAGGVSNQALATGTPPNGDDVTDLSGTALDNNAPTVNPLDQNPGIAISKVANTPTYDRTGAVITYTITVTNTGNVSLTDIIVTDEGADDAPSYVSGDTGEDQVLAPGEEWVFAAAYTIQPGDI